MLRLPRPPPTRTLSKYLTLPYPLPPAVLAQSPRNTSVTHTSLSHRLSSLFLYCALVVSVVLSLSLCLSLPLSLKCFPLQNRKTSNNNNNESNNNKPSSSFTITRRRGRRKGRRSRKYTFATLVLLSGYRARSPSLSLSFYRAD